MIHTVPEFKNLYFNDSYHIYNDGRVYSKISRRFLKGKMERKYLIYQLGRGHKYTAAKLVFFHFCDHDKKRIQDLNQISTIDKDPGNLHYTNLQELTKKEVMQKYGMYAYNRGGRICKIKTSEIEKIKKLRKQGFTQNKISKLYGVSENSVNRFINKHQIN